MVCVELFGEDKVYDYMPDDAEFPLVLVGEQFKQNDRTHKDYLNGQTQVTVHFWTNNPKRQGTLKSMVYDLEKEVQLKYKMRLLEANLQLVPDNSTGKDLLHGALDINVSF